MYDENVLVNPFPGLRAFEEEEDVLFFGREKQIDELLRKLRTSRFLAIIGSSGSGKSSLVKSGMLPSLHSGLMSGAGSQWRIALFRPGNDPIGQLTQSLSKNGVLRDNQTNEEQETNTAINETILRRSNLGLIETYKQSGLDKKTNLLVLVDQFEELFRFSKYEKEAYEGKRDSITFINLLLMASAQKELPIYVVFTMRSDFLGDCTEFRGLPEAINEGQYLIPRMTREERREAITGPVAVGGATITLALVNRLLNDVGDNPDQLPILQHALMRTWDSWRKKGHPEVPLDIEDYENIGTIAEALSQHAEEAYSELVTEKEKDICEKIFKELTDKSGLSSGIRRPRLLSELCAAAGASETEVIKVIDIFRKAGRGFLVPAVPTALTANSIIDISHESLMRVWKRLISWLAEEEESAQVYLHLCEAVNLYETGKGGLWRDPELQIALKWRIEQNTNAAWASRYNAYYDKVILFLEHSKNQRDLEIKHKEELQKQRLRLARRFAIVVSGIALVAFLLAIYSFQQKSIAVKEEKIAITNEKEAKNQKSIADKNKDEALKQKSIAEVAKDSAVKAELYAVQQKQLAEDQRKLALVQKGIAVNKSIEALQQKVRADSEATLATKNALVALANEKLAIANADKARREEDTANTLKQLAEAKNIANHSITLFREGKYKDSREEAMKAYQLNQSVHQFNSSFPDAFASEEIYQALHQNQFHSVKNVSNYHDAPIKTIDGSAGTNIVFSGDENGVLLVSKCENGLLKAISKINTGSEIRELKVSPGGAYLLSLHTHHLVLYNIKNDNPLTEYARIDFTGTGKRAIFLDNSHFLLLTSEGITKLEVINAPQASTDFVSLPNCSAIARDADGSIYAAIGTNVVAYPGWESIRQPGTQLHHFKAPVTSLTTDATGGHIAAGSYDGTIWIKNLQKNIQADFSLQHSAINELRFKKDADGNLQLASASSDKTIKLINVNSVLHTHSEDLVTLIGHGSWVYSLFYTPDGKYLLSGSEDRSIMSWYTTMSGIYNTLNKNTK